MPELPEVETVCRDLSSCGVLGKRIESISILWDKTIREPSTQEFSQQLCGRCITTINRRGKYIHMLIDNGTSLLVHLRMTGGFSIRNTQSRMDTHDRVVFHLGECDLVYHDTRKFGRMILTNSPQQILGKLGPEPLDPEFTAEVLHARLSNHRKMIKPLLLDQTFIAGLGNIYVDESLFLANIHPCRIANQISLQEAEKLHHSIQSALTSGINHRGTSLGAGEGNFTSNGYAGGNSLQLQVFRRTGLPCPVCTTSIERIVVGQRSTHYCPVCQKFS
jgi:formamidopyrimidine-DNA glycosylase